MSELNYIGDLILKDLKDYTGLKGALKRCASDYVSKPTDFSKVNISDVCFSAITAIKELEDLVTKLSQENDTLITQNQEYREKINNIQDKLEDNTVERLKKENERLKESLNETSGRIFEQNQNLDAQEDYIQILNKQLQERMQKQQRDFENRQAMEAFLAQTQTGYTENYIQEETPIQEQVEPEIFLPNDPPVNMQELEKKEEPEPVVDPDSPCATCDFHACELCSYGKVKTSLA